MFGSHRLIGSCLIILSLCGALIAQSDKSAPPRTTPIVTVSATDMGVRITAPGSIVQIQLAVYSGAGEKLFETAQNGNVLDYAAQDRAGVRLASGNYLCVVKVKSLSGKLSEKLGQLSVQETSVSVQPAETGQLTVAQTQILSPENEATPLTAPAENEADAATVIAHNGTDGQMIRGRGALSFRLGDFFRAHDKEQMRLSEDGNLDVAGTIRAQRFLVVKPGSADKNIGANMTADSVESVQPLVWGTGTTGKLTKWMDGTGGLADSIITETASNVGIGTNSPNSLLELKAASPILTFNADANDSYRGLNWMGAGYGANVLGSMLMNGHTGDLQIKSGYPGYGGFVSLHTNGLERMRATANGNIGIGTDRPNSLLELNSTTPILSFNANNRNSYQGMNWLANGYGPTPLASILMNGQLGELQMKSGYPGWGGFFTFHTNGLERMRIDPSGNVGIGTDTPGSKLTVGGVIESKNGGFKFPDGTTMTTAGASGAFVQKAGDTMTGMLTLPVNGLSAGTNQLILSAGNVGIGTASPGSKLTVNGVIESKSIGFKFPDGTVQTTAGGGGSGGGIVNQTTLQTGANFNIDGTGKANVLDANQYNLGGKRILIAFANDTALGLNQIPMNNVYGMFNTFVGGNCYSRTTAGSYNSSFGAYCGSVQVTGTGNSYFGAWAGGTLQRGNNNSFFGLQAGMDNSGSNNSFFGNDAGSGRDWISGNQNTLVGSHTNLEAGGLSNASAIGFRASVAQDNSLVLGSINGINGATANTNVGIGTTTPADRLDVNGDIRVGDTDTNGCLKNNNGGTIVGTCSSDLRFKRNLQTFGKVLNRVTQLQPVYFFWRAKEFPDKRFGNEREVGLVAQQVEQVMPELVTTDKDGYKMVDYSKLPLLTLQAVKELKAQNDALQQQNAAAQKENAALKARLDRLERSVKGMRRHQR